MRETGFSVSGLGVYAQECLNVMFAGDILRSYCQAKPESQTLCSQPASKFACRYLDSTLADSACRCGGLTENYLALQSPIFKLLGSHTGYRFGMLVNFTSCSIYRALIIHARIVFLIWTSPGSGRSNIL